MELEVQPNTAIATSVRQDLEDLSNLLRCFNIQVLPYKSSQLLDFHCLSVEEQNDVAKALHAYLQTLKAEYSRSDFSNERFIMQFLFRIGLLPPDDLSETLKNEHYIQIYNKHQLQIFRSLKCYERCSFTLEQMISRPWYDLWTRENLFYYALFGLACTVLKFVRFTKLRLDFPHHKVTEVDSFNTYSFDYKIKTLSALTHQKKIAAAILVEDWKY